MTGDSPLADAFSLLWSFDDEVLGVAWLSIRVSSAAVLAAAALALPVAVGLALGRFPGRRLLRATARALMMVPSVLIGLLLYMTLGRQGPVGALELLYTPWAIAIAQALLAFPMLTSLFAAAIEGADPVALDAARTAGAGPPG
ncbi:MAG: ABC transporter permease, partial [Myxococcota bacterium]|nr:ABC transporter permease [Myxococcota bacterium]